MNYYDARQRLDGKWDYTCKNDDYVFPVGYCRPWKPLDATVTPNFAQENEEHQPFVHKHHGEGHATEEEARECYKEYLLDHRVQFHKEPDAQHRCLACNAWCQTYAMVDGSDRYQLCEQHRNREEVAKRLPTPGQVWCS